MKVGVGRELWMRMGVAWRQRKHRSDKRGGRQVMVVFGVGEASGVQEWSARPVRTVELADYVITPRRSVGDKCSMALQSEKCCGCASTVEPVLVHRMDVRRVVRSARCVLRLVGGRSFLVLVRGEAALDERYYGVR